MNYDQRRNIDISGRMVPIFDREAHDRETMRYYNEFLHSHSIEELQGFFRQGQGKDFMSVAQIFS